MRGGSSPKRKRGTGTLGFSTYKLSNPCAIRIKGPLELRDASLSSKLGT